MPIPRGQQVQIGKVGIGVLSLGLLHSAATLAGTWATFLAMLGDGWWGTADPGGAAAWIRVAAFWSLWFGAAISLLGWILVRVGSDRPPLSMAFGAVFTAVAAVGALAVPAGASGG